MSDFFILRRTLPWLAIVLVLLSCSIVQPSQNQAGSETGRIIFQDNFSDPTSGWNRVTAPNGATDYADGMYRIWVNQANLDVWARPGLNLADISIEVEALKIDGDRDNRFGIICRITDTHNFYVFLITSDGYYGIGKVLTGQFLLLNAQRLQTSSHIQTGSATNHIRADCVGNTLTLFVNGLELARVQDFDLQNGDVGLLAGTYTSPGLDIRFDNFLVHEVVTRQP